ncbi:MAG: DUF2508 family protein [Ruminococcaceae bacterium]|nr:DUF2508 family protein [Oscillospiraceae bacterium]
MTEALRMGFLQRISKTKQVGNKAVEKELKQLYEQRSRVREELENTIKNYNYVTEEGLMDYYIYKIRSQQVLEEYLIKEIRKIEATYKTA